ncbi:MAG: hypothetical protein WB471_01930, partial [Nocardioides sp.]
NGFTEDDLGYRTWTTGTGARFYTQVTQGTPDQGRYRVYRWKAVEPSGSPERLNSPGVAGVQLVPIDLGTICFDYQAPTYERC